MMPRNRELKLVNSIESNTTQCTAMEVSSCTEPDRINTLLVFRVKMKTYDHNYIFFLFHLIEIWHPWPRRHAAVLQSIAILWGPVIGRPAPLQSQ